MSNTSHPRVIYIAPLSPWLVLQNLILPLIIKSMSITYIKYQNERVSSKVSTVSNCFAPYTFPGVSIGLTLEIGNCFKYKGLWLRVILPFLFVPLLFLLVIWLLMSCFFTNLPGYHVVLFLDPMTQWHWLTVFLFSWVISQWSHFSSVLGGHSSWDKHFLLISQFHYIVWPHKFLFQFPKIGYSSANLCCYEVGNLNSIITISKWQYLFFQIAYTTMLLCQNFLQYVNYCEVFCIYLKHDQIAKVNIKERLRCCGFHLTA